MVLPRTFVQQTIKTLKQMSAVLAISIFSLSISGAPALAQNVVISEFMANPVVITSANGEWIELHNTTNQPQDIAGYTVSTSSASHQLASSNLVAGSSLTLAPKGNFLMCRNTDEAQNGGIANCNYGWSGVNLDESGSTIGLKDNRNFSIDSVTYESANAVNGQSTIVERDANNQPALSQDSSNIYDVANGNTGTPGTANLDIDKPYVKINSPTSGQKIKAMIYVKGDISDTNLKDFKVFMRKVDSNVNLESSGWTPAPSDNMVDQNLYSINSVNYADGQYDIFVKARDENGLVKRRKVTITIDNTGAVVTVNKKSTNDRTPSLTGTVNDPTATLQVKINAQTYSATNNGDGTWSSKVGNQLEDGKYDVQVIATDEAGNITTDNTQGELTVDATAPVITVNKLTTTSHSPTLRGNVNDKTATIRVTVAGKTYTAKNNGDGTWILSGKMLVALGAHRTYDVTARATDSFGNVGTDKTSQELTVNPSLSDAIKTSSTRTRQTDSTLGSVGFGSSVSGDANMLDSDGDGIPDAKDKTPYGDNGGKDTKGDKDVDKGNVDGEQTENNFDFRWVILTGAIIAFLWFLLRQKEEA